MQRECRMAKKFITWLMLSGITLAQAGNLLTGDTSVETEDRSMTRGTWTARKLFTGDSVSWDAKTGFDGRRSIRIDKPCAVSLNETARLPKGKYVFSFYAKADKDNVAGFINCSEFQRSLWRFRIGKRKPVTLGKEWKRCSYVFDSDGSHLWVPAFGLTQPGSRAWFDAFQLEKGTEPTPYRQPEAVAGLTQVTTQEFNVWHPGEKMVFQAAARVKDPRKPYSFLFTGIDWNGKQVFSKTAQVKPDAQGFYSENFEFPTRTKGWFRIDAKLMQGNDAVASDFMTAAVVCKPVPTAPGLEPFGGAAGGTQAFEAMRRIGVGWLEWHMSWKIVERRKGQYDYKWLIDYDRMAEMKKKGFFNKVIYTIQAPSWEYAEEEAAEAKKLKLSLERYFPFDPKSLPGWRAFVADSMKRYGKYMDLIEVGGELDASYGLSTYFKKKYPQHIKDNYVYGPLLDRYLAIFRTASDEILRYKPGARLSSMRPSDVDARHQYAYTETVLRSGTGRRSNWLGLDCYPQPRWIGPNQPPTGHAALLLGKNVARAREIMKKFAKGDNIFVSEYGYFIDYQARHELKYQREQANRLATSLIVARANGAKSFFWYTIFPGASNSHEANRYLMAISDREQPFMGIAAYSAAVELLSNVVDTKILKLEEDLEICVFKKSDGTATAAVWSINPEYAPQIEIDPAGLRVTDMTGVETEVKNGWKLSEDPYYFWRTAPGEDNFAELCRTLEKIRIREKLPANIDIRQSNRNELRVILSSKSRTRTQTGTLTANGKSYRIKIPPEEFRQITVRCPADALEMNVAFDGCEPCRISYRKPDIIKVPKVRSFADAASFASLKINTPDHIEPVDHTTWSGPEDLSFELKLGHDADNLFIMAIVTDDRHFNKYDAERIWKGDCLQLAIDPQTNTFGRKRFNPDDYVITFALAQGQPQWTVHEGPNKLSLKKYAAVQIVRDERKQQTVYRLTLPLRYIDRTLLKPKIVFGMNAAFFDDDSGSGADYWMFLTRGLAGRRDCSLYRLFELD